MSEHVNEWLNAYLDGELHANRLHQVEKHLTECESCRTELESLHDLSRLLHEVPAPEFTSSQRFAAQVILLLPQKPVTAPRSSLEIGWWMIPVGLLAAWIFINTATLVSNMISAATSFGLLESTVAPFVSGSSNAVYWTSILGQFAFLKGGSLQWFEMTESYSRNLVPQFVWHVSIALLYLTWIAIWWARHMRQGYGRLLES